MGRLILILVILLPLSRYHFNIQTVQLNPENEIGIIIPTEDLYIIGIFSCRSPHSITKEAFAFLDSEGNIMDGLLSIRSKCEGLLIDEAIRQNQNAVFKNLDPSMRLLWTGGFYNLTESDNWKWSDEVEREENKYENFCKNQTEIIHLAKRKNETFLYIVKDFRFKNLKRNGRVCWQTLSKRELTDLNFDDGRTLPNRTTHTGPRLSFAC